MQTHKQTNKTVVVVLVLVHGIIGIASRNINEL
jgi:hypothetical protein